MKHTKPQLAIIGAGRMGMIRYNLLKQNNMLSFRGFYTNNLEEKNELIRKKIKVLDNLYDVTVYVDGI